MRSLKATADLESVENTGYIYIVFIKIQTKSLIFYPSHKMRSVYLQKLSIFQDE